jgi:hypothetical protein
MDTQFGLGESRAGISRRNAQIRLSAASVLLRGCVLQRFEPCQVQACNGCAIGSQDGLDARKSSPAFPQAYADGSELHLLRLARRYTGE